MQKNSRSKLLWYGLIILVFFILSVGLTSENTQTKLDKIVPGKQSLSIISSTENKDLEEILMSYARKNGINLNIDYAGTIEIMDKLNRGDKYDAVWSSNSIWLYMLDSSVRTSNSKSTSINPVVFGIKKSKAQELGFIGNDVYTKDILQAIKDKKLKFNMSSATQTNTGATAYLGFLSTLAGNPEILTKEALDNENLKEELKNLLSGVEHKQEIGARR